MRIKKKHNNKYLLSKTGVSWVRDFTTKNVAKIDINNHTSNTDATLFLRNEIANYRQMNGTLENSRIIHPNIVIVSDGYNWEKGQEILAELPYKEVAIIGVNKSLAKWKMVGEQTKVKRAMNFYVVNNPFEECMRFLPKHGYTPNCIASLRTNPKFAREYNGQTFFYATSNDKYFSSQIKLDVTIDDYRNPVCAAIQLAYLFGVQKLLLFCCDDSFDENKPGSSRLKNGLWTYPQQFISQHIIDANLYWLKKQNVRIGDCSMGIKYDSADYIETEQIPLFFREEYE